MDESVKVSVTLDLVLAPGTDPEAFGDRLFDALCEDEHDLIPDCESVDGMSIDTRRGVPAVASPGVREVALERVRQMVDEGWTAKHDDEHDDGSLAQAAIAYLIFNASHTRGMPGWWPWEAQAWKPSDDPIRNLVKAGALVVAEIDRLRRATTPRLSAPEIEEIEAEDAAWNRIERSDGES